MTRTWDDARLDPLRQVTDPVADGVAAAYFTDRQSTAPEPLDPGELFGHLVRNVTLDPEDQHPALAAYFTDPAPWPDWADSGKIDQAADLFGRWGLHVFSALYAASLPTAYACHRGVQVLHLTARLRTDAHRRLNETAQFHLEVLAPKGLVPGAPGHHHVRHVRLMHAGVRWLILNDPDVAKTSDESVSPRWDPAWGQPINQEDLLETLLTFTEIVFDVFDRTHHHYTAAEADAYLHAWCVIGHLLGVRDDLLPMTRDDTRALMDAVRRRQFAASQAGREMTDALLKVVRAPLPGSLKGMPATMVRASVGDEVADLLSVPPADWTRVLVASSARVDGLLTRAGLHPPKWLPTWLRPESASARLGRMMLDVLVEAERGGDRDAFEIPDELADRWRVRPG